MYKMKFAFVVLFLLLSDYMESVGTIEDLVVYYYDKNISTIDLLRRLNMSYSLFDGKDIKCNLFEYSCEAVCPLENEDQERMDRKNCYCDKLCVELGDCCFDYFLRCTAAKTNKPRVPKLTCVTCSHNPVIPFIKDNYGYAMSGSCPHHNTNKNLESLCTSPKVDFFGMLPVSDLPNRITYKNVFCASCIQASNLTYWNFSASCKGRYSSHDIPTNRSLMLAFIMTKCEWYFKPPFGHSGKVCLSAKENCPDSELVNEEPLLRDLCSFYSFPACPDFQSKNPHCDICKGKDISQYSCVCGKTGETGIHIPSLNILFDFSSSSHSVQVGERKSVVRNKLCPEAFVFNPFNEECVQLHAPMPVAKISFVNSSSPINRPSVMGLREGNYINCSYVEMNISSVTRLSNGSIWIPLHKRLYNKENFAINGSSLLLCADFKRVYTETETLVSMEIIPLRILTYMGCTISMISLIFLLGIYIALPELRTLPGKNLICLSCAMLSYHIFFLLTGQTEKPKICLAVSVLLHYFLLSSFCWMGVMAFDVQKTFGAKGKARPRHDHNRKALVKYSIFAWITPAVIVATSVTLDKTNTVFIRYAEEFCWISNGRALLLVLGIPVALILLFNVGALTLTMFSIWKVHKSTRRVTDQSNQTSLPILYIKLSSAMGFTWILGFIEPFTKIAFIAYLFVILNSLQGFFIFLAFVANKRTINKVRAGWMARFHRLKNTDMVTPQSRETNTSKLVTSTL